MTIAVSVLGAVLPSLLLLWFFYKRDLYPEPRGVLFKTFLLGVLTVFPVAIVTVPVVVLVALPIDPLVHTFLMAFLLAALPEEFFKFLVVTRYSARNPAFDEPMDGVVYGAAASLGFATFENILYVVQEGWVSAIARALTAVPMHAFLGAILGYYVGQARFNPRSGVSAWRGLWVAVLIHGLYDFGLLYAKESEAQGQLNVNEPSGGQVALALGMLGLSLGVFLTAGIWTWRIVRRLRKDQLALRDAGKVV
jgi:RsiW-degrading membrane proteinase PrsW (M82 family)